MADEQDEETPKLLTRPVKPGLDVLANFIRSSRFVPKPRDEMIMFRRIMHMVVSPSKIVRWLSPRKRRLK